MTSAMTVFVVLVVVDVVNWDFLIITFRELPGLVWQPFKTLQIHDLTFQTHSKKRKPQPAKDPPVSLNSNLNSVKLNLDPSHVIAWNEPLFTKSVYKHVSLPSWMLSLTYEHTGNFIGSIAEYHPTFANQVQVDLHKEMMRNYNEIKDTWSQPSNLEKLKDFLVRLCRDFPDSPLRPTTFYPSLPHHTFENTPRVVFPEFNADCFVPRVNKKGADTPPLLSNSNQTNSLWDIVEKCNVKSNQLTMLKLRSICRQCLNDGYTLDECLAVLVKKCYIWRRKESEPNYKKISWILPFLPTHILYYEVSDESRFINIFKEMMLVVRENVLNFVKDYYQLGELTNSERLELKRLRTENFANRMRTPEIQQLFTLGVPKRDVIDFVYNKYAREIGSEIKRDPMFGLKLQQKKTELRCTRLKQRDAKFARDNDFETQSLPVYLLFGFISTLGLHLLLKKLGIAYVQIMTWLIQFLQSCNQVLEQLTRANDTASLIQQEMAFWRTYFNNPIGHLTGYEMRKIQLMSVKSILHALYGAYSGDKKEVMTRLSDLLVLYPKYIPGILVVMAGVNFIDFALAAEESHPLMYYNGKSYSVSPKLLKSLIEAADKGQSIDDKFVDIEKNHFEPQSNPFVDAVASLTTLFKTHNMELTGNQLRELNSQYQYKQNVRRDTGDKLQTFVTIATAITRTFFGFDPTDPEFQLFVGTIMALIRFTDDHLLKANEMLTDKRMMANVVARYKEACAINLSPRMQTVPSFMSTIYLKRFKDLENLAKRADSVLKTTHCRTTPCCVAMLGPPSVGKTALTRTLEKEICDYEDLEYDRTMSYAFNPRDDFWEGYANNKFVTIDDVFKATDSAIRTIESTTIIDMINTSVMPLAMAALDSKGSYFFDSEYVFLTTNLGATGLKDCTWPVGLEHVDSLKRRLHIVLWKQEKLWTDLLDDRVTFQVQQCDMFPKIVKKWLTVKQIAELIILHKRKQKLAQNNYEYSKERLRQYFGQPHREIDETFFEDEPQLSTPTVSEVSVEDDDEEPPELEEVFETQSSPWFPETVKSTFAWTSNLRTEPLPAEDHIEQWLEIIRPEDRPNPLTDPKFYVAVFFILIAVIAASGFVYKYLFPEDVEDTVEPHAYRAKMATGRSHVKAKYERDRRKITEVKRDGPSKPKWVSHSVQTQSNAENYMACLVNNVSKSVVDIYGIGENPDTGKRYREDAMAVHLKDGLWCTPAHFFLVFQDHKNSVLTLSFGSSVLEFPLNQLRCFKVNQQDLVYFTFPKKTNLPPPAYKYLWDASNTYYIDPGTALRLVTLDGHGKASIKPLNMAAYPDPVIYPCTNPEETKEYETILIDHPITYYGNTEKGTSGALVTVETNQGAPLVIGVHLGCKTQCGVAMSLTKEDVDGVLSRFQTQSSGKYEFPHVILRRVPPELAHFPPQKSKIKRLPIHGWDGAPQEIPAKLAPFTNDQGELINPMYKAMLKQRQTRFKSAPIPDTAMEYLLHHYPPQKGEVTSFEEALNGDPLKGSTSINFGTSAGYPYSLGAKKGKAPYIELVDGKQAYSQAFRAEMEDKYKRLMEGEELEFIFGDCMKDEPRPIKKVEEGNTRLFSTSPLDHLILFRMFFLDLITFIQSRAATNLISIGINPHSLDWTRLHRDVSRHCGSLIAGDHQHYDGKICADVCEFVIKFANVWYRASPKEARARELLCRAVFQAKHIIYDIIYQVAEGVPSGFGGTGIINSLANVVIIFKVLTIDLKLRPDTFVIRVYGDDNLIGTDAVGIKASTLAPFMLESFNMVYTHWSKEESDTTDTLADVRYLGRGLIYDDSVVRAPLKIKTIVEATYWIKGDTTMDTVIMSTADSFFLELAHHPPAVFREYTDRYLETIKNCKNRQVANLYNGILCRRKMYSTYFKLMYDSRDGIVLHSVAVEVEPLVQAANCVSPLPREIVIVPPVAPFVAVTNFDYALTPQEHDLIRAYFNYIIELDLYDAELLFWLDHMIPRDREIATAVLLRSYIDNVRFEPQSRGRYLHSSQKQHFCRFLFWVLLTCVMQLGFNFLVGKQFGNLKAFAVTYPPSDSVSTTENTQFTDRAVNVLVDTQQVQLGSYQDANPISATAVSNTLLQSPQATTNMETNNFSKSLDREFLVGTFNWTTAMAVGATVGTVSFPDALFLQPFIAEKVRDYRYFRAAMRLSIRVTASRFVYGKIMVDFEPLAHLNIAPATVVASASGSPHVLVSASASEAVVFDAPFVTQKRALDIKAYYANEMGTFTIRVLNPLFNINGEVSTAQVCVTAQFIDAHVFMPHDSMIASGVLTRKGPIAQTHPMQRDIDFVAHSKREALAKSEHGVISSTLESTAVLASSVRNVPLIGQYASNLSGGAKAAAKLSKMIGLSKPSTEGYGTVLKMNPFMDLNQGKGIDTVAKLAMDPENGISTMPNVGGMNMDEMALKTFVSTPMLTKIASFFFSGTPATKLVTLGVETVLPPYIVAYVDAITQLFDYYAGTYKIKVYITASEMMVVQGVFWLADSDGQDWQYCYHRVVNITGDTEVEFSLPYTDSYITDDNGSTDPRFSLYFKTLTWSQPDNAIPAPMTLNVYKAGSSDFRFGVLKSTIFVHQSNPRADFNEDFEYLHPSMTGYLTNNLVFGEEYTTIREIIHKYEPYHLVSNLSINSFQTPTVTSGGTVLGVERLALYFRFYRGSMRIKFVSAANGTVKATQACTLTHNGKLVSTVGLGNRNNDPICEFEVPSYSNLLFKCCRFEQELLVVKKYNTTAESFMFKAAGDDFSYHWMKAPEGYIMSYPDTVYPTAAVGLMAFVNYLTA